MSPWSQYNEAILAILAIVLNGTMVLLIRIRMYMMAGICNKVLLTIRQELYTHIQTLDFHFFDSRPNGKILARIIGDINSLKDVLNNFVTTLLPDAVTPRPPARRVQQRLRAGGVEGEVGGFHLTRSSASRRDAPAPARPGADRRRSAVRLRS